MLMAILLAHSTSGIASGKKKFVATWKWQPFWNIEHSFNLASDMRRLSQIMPKNHFNGDGIINDVPGRTECRLLYSCLKEVGSGSKLQGQCPAINENTITIFLGYTSLKKISISNTFWDCRSKLNIAGLLSDFNGHNSISLGILKMEPKLKCKK